MSVVDEVFDVRGQVALVTGGASGLGYAFASILADAGARVVIADWNGDALEKAVVSLADAAAAARAAAGREPPAVERGETGGIQTPPLVTAARSTSPTPPPCTPWSIASSTSTAGSTSSSPTPAWPAAAPRCSPRAGSTT